MNTLSAQASFAAGRTVHAWLICGPEGSGKLAYATHAAQALLCTQPKDGHACAHCPACLRVQSGNHPDVITLKSEKSTLGVDEIRELIASLGQRAYEGGRRAVIIRDAQKLTPQAQNALLKSLEEPGEGINFFLLSTDASVMLPTIRSRCRMERIRPSGDVCARLSANGIDPLWAQELALYCSGAYEKALGLVDNPTTKQARDKALTVLSLENKTAVPALWQSLKDDKELAQDILSWLECFAGDILRHFGGGAILADTPQRAARFTIAQIDCIIERILNVKKMLASNVPWQNAVESLLFVIAEGEKG